MIEFHKGDRVVYSGPVLNESWDNSRVGTVLSVHDDLINIRWDHGVINEGQEGEFFKLVHDE